MAISGVILDQCSGFGLALSDFQVLKQAEEQPRAFADVPNEIDLVNLIHTDDSHHAEFKGRLPKYCLLI